MTKPEAEEVLCAACNTDLKDKQVILVGDDKYCNDFACWGQALEPGDKIPDELAPDEETGVDITFGAFIDIRLTDAGRDMLERNWTKLAMVGVVTEEYAPPIEDDAGYSRWTLLKFMTTFGPALYTGAPKYFEDDAIIYPV